MRLAESWRGGQLLLWLHKTSISRFLFFSDQLLLLLWLHRLRHINWFLLLRQQYNQRNVTFLWFGQTFVLKLLALPRKYKNIGNWFNIAINGVFCVFKLKKVIWLYSFSDTSVDGRNTKIIEERGERVLFSASLGFQLNWQVQTQLESESKYFCRWLGGLVYKPQLSQSSQAGESSDRGFSSLN